MLLANEAGDPGLATFCVTTEETLAATISRRRTRTAIGSVLSAQRTSENTDVPLFHENKYLMPGCIMGAVLGHAGGKPRRSRHRQRDFSYTRMMAVNRGQGIDPLPVTNLTLFTNCRVQNSRHL